eukprot:gene10962-11045_t
MRHDPVGHFELDGIRHFRMFERAAFEFRQRVPLGGVQRGGAELAAGEALHHAGQQPAFGQQRGGGEQARVGAELDLFEPPRETAARAQDGPDSFGHRPAITGADVSALAEVIVGDGVGRFAGGGVDGGDQLDGGGYPRGC